MRCSLSLIVPQRSFLQGSQALTSYELLGESHGPYWYVENSPIKQIITNFPRYLEQVGSSDQDEVSPANLAHFSLLSGNSYITVILSSWAQRAYELTALGNFLFINLELGLGKDKCFISTQDEKLPFLIEIIRLFAPLYGWVEEWIAEPSFYWDEEDPPPSRNAPWHTSSMTQILGKPLSLIVEDKFDFTNEHSGLFFVREIGDDLFFITQPGDTHDRSGRQDNEVYRKHIAAVEKLWSALKAIPQSVLTK